jgi:hypothetical protein
MLIYLYIFYCFLLIVVRSQFSSESLSFEVSYFLYFIGSVYDVSIQVLSAFLSFRSLFQCFETILFLFPEFYSSFSLERFVLSYHHFLPSFFPTLSVLGLAFPLLFVISFSFSSFTATAKINIGLNSVITIGFLSFLLPFRSLISFFLCLLCPIIAY